MKKIVLIGLMVVFVFCVTGCSSGDSTTQSSSKEKNKKEQAYPLDNTYTTNSCVEYDGEARKLMFDYSNNWIISVHGKSSVSSINETVILQVKNKAGYYSDLKFMCCNDIQWCKQDTDEKYTVKIEKVADSKLALDTCISVSGERKYSSCVVAKVTIIEYSSQGMDIPKSVNEIAYYTVLPETSMGETTCIGRSGIEKICYFEYNNLFYSISINPGQECTESEEQEFIEILSSFRVESSDNQNTDLEYTETEEAQSEPKEEGTPLVELTQTYITKFSEANAITYPRLLFEYPDNWTISVEEVTPTTEKVVLTNERGVNIEYLLSLESSQGYTYTVFAYRADVSKVADSNFVPGWIQDSDYTHLGKFMVAKVDVNGELDRQLDSEYTDIDGGAFYVIAPESKIGTIEYIPEKDRPYSEFDFGYGSFVAYAPDNQFTEQEVQEITQILASFRTE